MVTQLAPAALQRCHARTYVIVGVPSHVPWLSVSAEPCWVVPERAGAAVTNGARAAMTAVCGAVPVAVPAVFVPVTTTRIVEPTSDAVSVYVEAVADGMSAHEAPAALQRRHWYV